MNHHAALKTTRRRILASLLLLAAPMTALASTKSVYYITPGLDLPFWRTLGLGIGNIATQNGYQLKVLDSKNSDAQQLSNIEQAIREQAAGIVLSPTDSKSAQAVLELTSRARVPVVIADIGSNGGEFVSYVKSDNYRGAFGVGQAVAAALKEKKLKDPAFALCTIALTRKNGQDRTNGFLDAMKEAGYTNMVALRQMQTYTKEETYQFVKEILRDHPKVAAIFIEVDKPTLGALTALKELRRLKEIVVGSYDGIPEFVDHLKSGNLVAVGMQQPFLMGTQSAEILFGAIQGKKQPKQVLVPVLNATSKNVSEWLPVAEKTVFGAEKPAQVKEK
ncbi:substrate-binding domain-containing protein [Undibacterium squillarum]|uniref:substrate-binding domain-containing protein n=1 Tax=Undibacterium squillarum TaxID=1131567 RepID=UPI0035B12D55